MSKYLMEEENCLNTELRKMQTRARGLILSDYYDCVALSELQHCILKKLTNAECYKDVNTYLWNSGTIEKTLDFISENLKEIRKNNR